MVILENAVSRDAHHVQPWLSVIIPTFNAERYLADALDSIVQQNEPQLEVLAIDDGSSDQTLSILRKYQSVLDLKIVEAEPCGNWVRQTNRALQIASGEFVSILHQDDAWARSRCATIREVLSRYPDAEVILHQAQFIDAQGRRRGLWNAPFPAVESVIMPQELRYALSVQNFIAVPAIVFRRGTFSTAPLLDESLWYTADWKCWFDLLDKGTWVYCPRPLSSFRLHRESQTLTVSKLRGVTDYLQQHLAVQERALESLEGAAKSSLIRAARFSTTANIALVSLLHGYRVAWCQLCIDALRLGPMGWWSYLRYSRIHQRLGARLRVHFDSRLN